jgi:prolipoprotein diacylglyceryl transferase
MSRVLASIPSPSSGTLEIGPLTLNAYGLMIAVGVVVAVQIAGRRAAARDAGSVDDLSSIAVWAVPAGIVGARAYHVITDADRFAGRWLDAFKIWEGGLGIWGGVAVGVVVGLWRARVRGLDPVVVLGCAAPAIPVAQAIGRWGNWFNQELFGGPTTLPWALEVSPETAVSAGYLPGTTFHPTFLYESLACLTIAGVLVMVDRRRRPDPGRLFAGYVALYTLARFLIEGLRIDEARSWAGLRLNQWVAAAVFLAAVGWLSFGASRPGSVESASSVDPHE